MLEVGTDFAREFIKAIPDFGTHERYDPGRDEMITEIVDNSTLKIFSAAGLNIFKQLELENLKGQLGLFLELMIRSYDLHAFYKEVQKEGLPKFFLKDIPSFKNGSVPYTTSTFNLRGSVFALLTDEENLNDNWDSRTPSYRSVLQIGLPFERSSKLIKNREYYRPYLVVGYERLNILMSENTGTNFIGGSYISEGIADQEYQLSTSTDIILRSHSWQVGAIYKSLLPSDIYIDLGGGIRKKWRSALIFDKDQNYLSDPNLTLASSKQKDVLETNHINPYLEITVGRNFYEKRKHEERCGKENMQLDVFFNAYFTRVNLEPNSNFQLYKSSFEPGETIPYTSPTPNKKWYPAISMGIGFNFF